LEDENGEVSPVHSIWQKGFFLTGEKLTLAEITVNDKPTAISACIFLI
jgi:hypothetical protein